MIIILGTLLSYINLLLREESRKEKRKPAMRRKQLSYLLSAVVIVSLMTGSVSAKEQNGIKECFECCRFTTPFHTSA